LLDNAAGLAAPSWAAGLRTVGVEEEFLLVDSIGGRPIPAAGRLAGPAGALTARGSQLLAGIGTELQQEQVETATAPCTELTQLHEQLRRLRRRPMTRPAPPVPGSPRWPPRRCR
jgi:carboxylate-amine ligase